MRALLYKDYIATQGNQGIWGCGFLTLFIAGFAVWCHFDSQMELVLGMFTPMVFCFGVFYLMALMSLLFKADSGKNCRDYLLSLPVDKKEYLASKYVYFLIVSYLVLSWGVLLVYIPLPVVELEGMLLLISAIQLIGPFWVYAMLIFAAIAFPLYILYGRKKGDMIFSAITITLCIGFFIWLLFGDTSGLTNMDFEVYMKKIEANEDKVILLHTAIPVVTGILYYLSYRITAVIYARKEREIDE